MPDDLECLEIEVARRARFDTTSSVPSFPRSEVRVVGERRIQPHASICFYCKETVYGHKCQNCGAPA